MGVPENPGNTNSCSKLVATGKIIYSVLVFVCVFDEGVKGWKSSNKCSMLPPLVDVFVYHAKHHKVRLPIADVHDRDRASSQLRLLGLLVALLESWLDHKPFTPFEDLNWLQLAFADLMLEVRN